MEVYCSTNLITGNKYIGISRIGNKEYYGSGKLMFKDKEAWRKKLSVASKKAWADKEKRKRIIEGQRHLICS